jgi:hypothetical protein
MRSCPGCGLSLSDDASFCPTCGWQRTAAAAQDTPAAAPATSGAAAIGIGPTASTATSDSDPASAVLVIRKALAYGLMPAVVILESIAWYVALPHLHFLGHQALREIQGFLLFVCTLISITATAWLYPPVAKEYTAWFDRQFLAAPRESGYSTLGKVVMIAIPSAVWLVIVLVILRASR